MKRGIVLRELNNLMLRSIADLNKAKGSATKYRIYDKFLDMFHWNVLKVCCCVFIGMHFIFIYKCCLMIYRNKMARYLNYMYGKT